MQSIQEVV
jgi:hypothetical protein